VPTPQFDAQARAIEPNVRRFDELFRGIEWALARTPQTGRVVLTADLGSAGPRVKVTATVEANTVTLTAITLTEEVE
jgi:hypothetical protein